jgi:hypothetical protein
MVEEQARQADIKKQVRNLLIVGFFPGLLFGLKGGGHTFLRNVVGLY